MQTIRTTKLIQEKANRRRSDPRKRARLPVRTGRSAIPRRSARGTGIFAPQGSPAGRTLLRAARSSEHVGRTKNILGTTQRTGIAILLDIRRILAIGG